MGNYTDEANKWDFVSKQNGHAHTGQLLWLGWSVNWDATAQDSAYADEEELSDQEVFRRWLQMAIRQSEQDEVGITWSVRGEHTAEWAPLTGAEYDFLTYFQTPTNAITGDEINWLRLPIRPDYTFLGASGWEPTPLQPTVSLRMLERRFNSY